MLDNGFIKIYRSLLKWEWYDDLNTFRVFIHLLLTVNYEDKKWHGIEIKRGQRVISYEKLAKETSLTVRQVRTSIDKLKMTHEITSTATNKYTIVTIENYDKFQVQSNQNDIQVDKQSSKEKTNERQASDKQTTTMKESKRKIKKDKESKKKEEKNIYAEFVSMTNAEYEKLVSTYGLEFTNMCIKILDNYKGSSGKKYASDYRTILSWVVDRAKQEMQKQSNTKKANDNTSSNPFLDMLGNEVQK